MEFALSSQSFLSFPIVHQMQAGIVFQQKKKFSSFYFYSNAGAAEL